MANRWLVQNIIDSAKLRGLVIESDDPREGFGPAQFLQLIDETIRGEIIPLLKRTKESYLLTSVELDLESGRARYPLPPRASAEAIHSILIDPDNGTEAWPPLSRTEAEKAYAFSINDGNPFAYYLEDDSVVFVPTPGDGEAVRFKIFGRPNMVVEATSVGQISAINTATKQVTVLAYDEDSGEFEDTTPPATFTTGATYDLVKGTPGFRCHDIDLAVSGVASNVLTFTDELPEDLAVGDFVCIAGETPIAQIPAELHPLLSQMVTRTILEGKGDPKADRAERTAGKLEKNATDMLSPRVQTAPKFVQNYNAPGWRRGLFRWRGWR